MAVLIVSRLAVGGWAGGATAPRGSWPRGGKAAGEQSEDRGGGAGRRQPDADARGALDDAGRELDQAKPQRRELGGFPARALGCGGAQGVQQPVGGGMENEPELIGAGAAARGPVRGELGLVQLDEVLGLAARAVDRVIGILSRAFGAREGITGFLHLGRGLRRPRRLVQT